MRVSLRSRLRAWFSWSPVGKAAAITALDLIGDRP